MSRARPFGSREPVHVLFEITDRCAQRCAYCYGQRRRSSHHAAPGLITQILTRVQADVEVSGVTLIGGEPTEHPELVSIVEGVRGLGLPVAISTNGWGLSPELIATLLRHGVRNFEVSLDSLDAAIYRGLGRGEDPGPIRTAIAELVARRAFVTVSAVLSRPMLAGLRDLIDFCFGVGVSNLSLFPILGRGPDHLTPSHAELVEALALCNEAARELSFAIACSVPFEPCRFPEEVLDHLLRPPCGCAETKWLIDSSGRLRACELAPDTIGDLKTRPFRELAGSQAAELLRDQDHFSHCGSCPDRRHCGGGCRFLGAAE